MTYIYPLQNLTSDIKKQLETFFSHLGCLPKRLITDFDTKLIGGKAREYLNGLLIHTNAEQNSYSFPLLLRELSLKRVSSLRGRVAGAT